MTGPEPSSRSQSKPKRPVGTRAAIYARISRDPEHLGAGVSRQVEDCREYCEQHGYQVVAVYDEDNKSAWTGKARPKYEQMLDDMESGFFDVVVVWHIDRLMRSVRDLVDLIEIAEAAQVTVEALQSGDIDLSTSTGQLTAHLGAAIAAHESHRKAERIRRKHQELALQGKPASVAGSFGYNKDGSVNEDQAAVIRTLAERILAGDSLRSVTAWLTEQKIPTAKGGAWSSSTVKQILTSGRIAGWREWTPGTPSGPRKRGDKPRRGHGDGPLVAEADGWEAIITLDEHQALRALLLDPSRRKTRRRHYLLSAGILKCGLCQKSMNHKTETQHSSKRDAEGKRIVLRQVSRYACIKQYGRGCGRMSISCPDVDDLVTAAICQTLSRSDLRFGQEDNGAAIRAQAKVQNLLLVQSKQDKMWSSGELDDARYLRMKAETESALAEAHDAVDAISAPLVLHGLRGDLEHVVQAWESLSLDRRRAVVQALVSNVEILPARPPKERPQGFDRERVVIHWLA